MIAMYNKIHDMVVVMGNVSLAIIDPVMNDIIHSGSGIPKIIFLI
jgi:hypothetical protein